MTAFVYGGGEQGQHCKREWLYYQQKAKKRCGNDAYAQYSGAFLQKIFPFRLQKPCAHIKNVIKYKIADR
jgi:hypothetical protein